MKFGYARISKQDNNYYLYLQKKKILKEGVTIDDIYIDVSDVKDEVYQNLERCLSLLKSGDELVVYSLDRFGKVFSQLATMLSEFDKKVYVYWYLTALELNLIQKIKIVFYIIMLKRSLKMKRLLYLIE